MWTVRDFLTVRRRPPALTWRNPACPVSATRAGTAFGGPRAEPVAPPHTCRFQPVEGHGRQPRNVGTTERRRVQMMKRTMAAAVVAAMTGIPVLAGTAGAQVAPAPRRPFPTHVRYVTG